MGIAERVDHLVAPLLVARGIELVDVEHAGGTLRITIDRAGGVDMAAVAEVTRMVSRALDDADPVPGHYTLEVSSPGLERPLRKPDHYQRAVGSDISVKLRSHLEGERRITGVLVASDERGVTLRAEGGDERRLEYADIDKARTVFQWGPGPKPGSKKSKRQRRNRLTAGDAAESAVPDSTRRASTR